MTSPPDRPGEIRALSGARALPPLILVLFHYCEGHGYRGFFWFDVLAAKGYLWVEFFFTLSGFILTYVYGNRVREFWRGRGYPQFLQARLARLYPVHLFMLLFVLMLLIGLRALAHIGGYASIYDQAYHPVLTLPTFIANLFLVQAWNLFPYLSWNGVAWFVSVEFFLCLLFPLYLWWSQGGFVRAIAIIAAGAGALVYLANTSGHGLDITFHNGILRGMSEFAIGVGLAMIFRHARHVTLPNWIHSTAQIAMLLALGLAIYNTGWSHRPADLYMAFALMGFIFLLAFDRGIIADTLKTAPFQRLGEWSYAIYMGQTAWLQLIRFIEQRFYPAPDALILGQRWKDLLWWGEPAVLLVICVVWGALLSTYVEKPGNRALKRLFARGTAPA